MSPRFKSMTRRSAAMLALLILLGFLGNFYTVTLFFGADFLFGSVAVLLVLYFYGLGWGLIAAVIANSNTYFLWGHPYGFISFTLEALCVGLVLRSRPNNLLLVDGLFWLGIGIPLAGLFYGVVLHMGATTMMFVALKQSINGIFNALLASLAISYLPLSRLLEYPQTRKTFTLQETLFNILVALVLIPVILLTIIEINKERDKVDIQMATELQALSTDIQSNLQFWYQPRLGVVTTLANAVAKSTMTPSAKLQDDTEMLKEPFSDFQNLLVEDAAGTVIACSPAINAKGVSNLGFNFSDRAWFKEVKASQKTGLSEAFLGERVTHAPLVVLSVPILRENQFLGCANAALDLSFLSKILETFGKNKGVIITLSDSRGQIIASTSREHRLLQSYNLKKTGVVTPINATLFRWSPADEKLASMTRWKMSFLVQETIVDARIPWTLAIEAPIAPHQANLYAIYVQNLSVAAFFILMALLMAFILSRWLVNPLERLAKVTTDLPYQLTEHRHIDWPASSALEVDSLITNFQSMTQALERNFQTLEESAKALTKTNEELKIKATERQQAEEALRDNRDYLENIIANSVDSIGIVDQHGKFTRWNKAAEELFGGIKRQKSYLAIRMRSLKENQALIYMRTLENST